MAQDQDQDQELRLDGRNGKAPWQNLTKLFLHRSAKQHAAHLLPYIQPNSRILDIGCGLGSITIDLANLASEGQTTGIDSNPETTQAAKGLAASRKIKNITFQLVDINNLTSSFEEETFDIIHAHQVILHLPDPVAAIREIHRLLKPGGLFTTRDTIMFRVWPEEGADEALNNAREMFRKFTNQRRGDFSGGKCNHVWVHEGGFVWEKIKVECGGLNYSTLEEGGIWAGGMKGSYASLGGKGVAPEEIGKLQELWTLWAEKPEAKVYGMDGVVLAWK